MYPCPQGLEYLWGWFIELNAGRTSSGFGANALTWVDMDAWSRMTDRKPDPFELECIRAIDGAYFKTEANQRDKEQESK